MLRYALCIAVSFMGLVASIFVFDIRRWARKLILYTCLFFLGLGIITDVSDMMMSHWYGVKGLPTLIAITFNFKKLSLYVFWLILIIFLQRPQIKAQFR